MEIKAEITASIKSYVTGRQIVYTKSLYNRRTIHFKDYSLPDTEYNKRLIRVWQAHKDKKLIFYLAIMIVIKNNRAYRRIGKMDCKFKLLRLLLPCEKNERHSVILDTPICKEKYFILKEE